MTVYHTAVAALNIAIDAGLQLLATSEAERAALPREARIGDYYLSLSVEDRIAFLSAIHFCLHRSAKLVVGTRNL